MSLPSLKPINSLDCHYLVSITAGYLLTTSLIIHYFMRAIVADQGQGSLTPRDYLPRNPNHSRPTRLHIWTMSSHDGPG